MSDHQQYLDRLTRAFKSNDKAVYVRALMNESVLPMAVYAPDNTITKHMCVGEYESHPDRGIVELVVRTTTPEGETFQTFRPYGPPRKEP